MCSVVGCYSGRRRAEQFKLPEDPEERLQWVMFLAKTNKQRFKESSWTDITVCCEHFTGDSFVDETHPVQLNPGAVPSLCLTYGPPDEPMRSPGCEELEDNSQCADLQDPLNTSPDPTPYSKGSSLKPLGSSTDPVPAGASRSPDSFECGRARAEQGKADLIKEKTTLLQKTGKFPVNENLLLQSFGSDCPSCGGKLKVHKVICGVVVSFNQLCLQCDYTYEWKSQVDGSVPAAEDGHVKAGLEAAIGDEAPSSVLELPEIVAVTHEESDSRAEWERSSDPGEVDSDEEWKPAPHVFPIKLYAANPTEGSGKHVEYCDYLSLTPVHSQLCADCGRFVDGRKPHICEHKARPYSCYICGKRCVSEAALSFHSRVHSENHEFRCKFCHAAFKLRADKVTHEQTHGPEGKPYKCPDCSKTFATNKERRVHLEDHRGTVDLKCRFCGVEFDRPLSIQRHLLVHTGVKPYKCLVCQRSFNQASHLKSHMRLHTGERPYHCQLCDKSFNHNVSLKSHVQRHHPSCSGPEQTKGTKNRKKSGPGGAQDNTHEEEADVNLDSEEKGGDTDDEMETRPQTKRSIGRPKGTPKGFGSGMKNQAEGSNTGARKSQIRRRKRQKMTDEDRLSDGNTSFDSEDEG